IMIYSCKKPRDFKEIVDLPPEPPMTITFTTKIPDSITSNCCISGGEIVTNKIFGVTERGICWSTDRNPTAALVTRAKNKLKDNPPFECFCDSSFQSVAYNLTPNTLYYLRAYAIIYSDTVYAQEESFTTTAKDTNLSLGQYHSGGIIFYLDSTKEHGLVCAPFDAGVAKWGCEATFIGGTSSGIGDGANNTRLILAGCAEEKSSARICDSLVLNFYDDWYMPSIDELRLMYENVHKKGKGNFSSLYHSSTEYDNSSAWALQFTGNASGNGIPYGLWKGGS